jgi:hypothetical protein
VLDFTPAPLSDLLNTAQESVYQIASNPNLGHTPVPAQLKPSNAWAKKAEAVIAGVENDVRQAAQTLSFPAATAPHPSILKTLIDNATQVVEYAGKSLAAVKHDDPVVQHHKKRVTEMLQGLSSRVAQLRVYLPAPIPEPKPMLIDAGKKPLYTYL